MNFSKNIKQRFASFFICSRMSEGEPLPKSLIPYFLSLLIFKRLHDMERSYRRFINVCKNFLSNHYSSSFVLNIGNQHKSANDEDILENWLILCIDKICCPTLEKLRSTVLGCISRKRASVSANHAS